MYTALQRTRKSKRKSTRKTKNAPGWFGGDESAVVIKMQHSGMDQRDGCHIFPIKALRWCGGWLRLRRLKLEEEIFLALVYRGKS